MSSAEEIVLRPDAKILLVQTSFIGDSVLTLPLVSELKRRFPKAMLSLLCTPKTAELLRDYPLVDEIILDDKRGRDRGWRGLSRKATLLKDKNFDLALCPHKSFRSGLLLYLAGIPRRVGYRQSKAWYLFHARVHRNKSQHEIERNLSILAALGIELSDCRRELDLPISPAAEGLAARVFAAAGIDTKRLTIGMIPGSVWHTKKWAAESFARLAELLRAELNVQVVLFGGPEDAQTLSKIQSLAGDHVVNLGGKTSLAELPAAISRCALVISNDSAPMHIAVARRVPVVAIFCATTPSLGFYPYSSNALIVEKQLPCRPCAPHGGRRCPLGTEDCIRLIRPEDVLRGVRRLLKHSGEAGELNGNGYEPQRLPL